MTANMRSKMHVYGCLCTMVSAVTTKDVAADWDVFVDYDATPSGTPNTTTPADTSEEY